jgi:hypothetical protein
MRIALGRRLLTGESRYSMVSFLEIYARLIRQLSLISWCDLLGNQLLLSELSVHECDVPIDIKLRAPNSQLI